MTRLEKDIKRTIEEYLQYKMNAGKLIFFRLNTGNIIIQGDKPRRFKGCGIKGASDFLVIGTDDYPFRACHISDSPPYIYFVEVKSDTGEQSSEQFAFQETVEKLGCEYILARKLEDVSEII